MILKISRILKFHVSTAVTAVDVMAHLRQELCGSMDCQVYRKDMTRDDRAEGHIVGAKIQPHVHRKPRAFCVGFKINKLYNDTPQVHR